MKVVTPNSERFRELFELFRNELDLPDGVEWFEVRFAVDEPVSVTCSFSLTEKDK